jgi:hypothetical protein
MMIKFGGRRCAREDGVRNCNPAAANSIIVMPMNICFFISSRSNRQIVFSLQLSIEIIQLKTAGPAGFCGSAPEGGMSIDVRSQKVGSAPAGRHIHAHMSLLTELASFLLLQLYTFRAAGASQMPNPQNPMRSAVFSFQLPSETSN